MLDINSNIFLFLPPKKRSFSQCSEVLSSLSLKIDQLATLDTKKYSLALIFAILPICGSQF